MSLIATALIGMIALAYGVASSPRPGMTFEFGGCYWSPPSPKAAAAFIDYFYGIGAPLVLPSEYEASIEQQLVAAGETPHEAKAEMGRLDRCMARYVTPAKDHGVVR